MRGERGERDGRDAGHERGELGERDERCGRCGRHEREVSGLEVECISPDSRNTCLCLLARAAWSLVQQSTYS